MSVPTWVAGVARVLLVCSMPLILLVSPLYLFAANSFVAYEYARPGFPPSIRFSPPERLRLSGTTVAFVRSRASRQALETMRTDGGEIAMRVEEVQHLEDVRVVIRGFLLAHAVALLVALASALWMWFSPERPGLAPALRLGLWITAGLIAFIVLLSFVNFDAFFTRFHQLFFAAGSWLFYEDDTLIQLYPLPLWMDAVRMIGLTVLGEMVLLWALAGGVGWLARRAAWPLAT